LYWQSLSSLVYHLMETPGAYPRRKHLKGAPIGFALALPSKSNSKTCLERVSKDQHFSLLDLNISNEGKKFFNIDPRLKLQTTKFGLTKTSKIFARPSRRFRKNSAVPPRKFPAASSSERSTFVGLSSTPPKVTNKRCQRNPSPSVF
jgi:hypothetical protein